MSSSDCSDFDLPLKANTCDISVYHYVLDLQCDMQSKVLHGSITLYLRPVVNPDEDREQCISNLSSVSCDHLHMHNSKVEHTHDNKSVPTTNSDVRRIQDFDPVTWGTCCDHGNYCRHESYAVEVCTRDKATICAKDAVEHLHCSDIVRAECQTETIVSTEAQTSSIISSVINKNRITCDEIKDSSKKEVRNNIMTTKHAHSRDFHMNASNNVEESHKEGIFLSSPLPSSIETCVDKPHSCDVPDDVANLVRTSSQVSPFCFILDCVDVTIKSVEEITLPDTSKILSLHNSTVVMKSLLTRSKLPGTKLPYCMEKWCIKIWKPGVSNSKEFPRAVRISYHTNAEGASLRWTQDQDGR